ncbi:hypothetical protein [Streptomyces sp. MMS20-AI2-20]|uniref:hypothetical protein n=1 Tax=Streptomyces sp. MMS20-AI2-20 TaxID=2925835 RepID=UPI001F60E2C0|nr:hypothetical protein [Streptomyces sp. MMS20-AI2-20]MCI4146683.1 hypothetical protein [Streptomyces sp. MMS20-AI2-20]
MSLATFVVLFVAGVSEAAGRIAPLVARRPGLSRPFVLGMLLVGGVVEATVFALWPLTAGALAGLLPSAAPSGAVSMIWTPALAAPLLLAAVLAMPLVGPALHTLLVLGVGADLSGPLAEALGVSWWTAAGCLGAAGAGLAVSVELVRRAVVAISGARRPGVVV